MKRQHRIFAFLMVLLLVCSLFSTAAAATAGEQNALRSAKSYLSIMGFSRSGLMDQLEYEGYSAAEAAYAVDNCGADWYQNALKSAKSYLSITGFSHSGLVDQLEYDGYTPAEAAYGADNCGADWYANAVTSAKSYLSFMNFSHSQLVDQLEYEGYTPEQALYAANVCFDKPASVPLLTPTPSPMPTATFEPFTPFATTAPASSTVDFSTYTYAELKQLQTRLNAALWASDGWQKVTVPPGVYIVGQDIPAGRWQISEARDAYFRSYKTRKNGDLSGILQYSDLKEPFVVFLDEGNYVEILHGSVYFAPYVSGLGFSFN